MTRELRRRAYAEAAQVLRARMDEIDLPEDLSAEEEDEMREFIRTEVCGQLDRRARSAR